jgi:hypothetical protein
MGRWTYFGSKKKNKKDSVRNSSDAVLARKRRQKEKQNYCISHMLNSLKLKKTQISTSMLINSLFFFLKKKQLCDIFKVAENKCKCVTFPFDQ